MSPQPDTRRSRDMRDMRREQEQSPSANPCGGDRPRISDAQLVQESLQTIRAFTYSDLPESPARSPLQTSEPRHDWPITPSTGIHPGLEDPHSSLGQVSMEVDPNYSMNMGQNQLADTNQYPDPFSTHFQPMDMGQNQYPHQPTGYDQRIGQEYGYENSLLDVAKHSSSDQSAREGTSESFLKIEIDKGQKVLDKAKRSMPDTKEVFQSRYKVTVSPRGDGSTYRVAIVDKKNPFEFIRIR